MEEPACTVRCAGIQDVPAMLDYEQKYFDICWHSKLNTVQNLIKKDPMMFRVCQLSQEIKGYYGVIPLPYAIWSKILKGEISEQEALHHVVSFTAPDIYLYIYSVVVDLADQRHKIYTRTLIRDFARQYVLRASNKSNIKAVGAFTVSDGGRRLVERSNFTFKGTFRGANGKYVRSYATSLDHLAQQIMKSREKRKQLSIA